MARDFDFQEQGVGMKSRVVGLITLLLKQDRAGLLSVGRGLVQLNSEVLFQLYIVPYLSLPRVARSII
jgi:hypothetical protein